MPLRGINKSPSQLATGRQLRDGIPAHRTVRRHYNVTQNWRKTLMDREKAMADSNRKTMERHANSKVLPPMVLGTKVHVQNQANNRWDRSGTITEVLPFRKYTVQMDGSGRLTKRNRRHLKVKISQPDAAEAAPNDTISDIHMERRPSRERRHPDQFIPGQIH